VTIDPVPTDMHPTRAVVIVCAHDEQDRLPATLAAVADAFPDGRVVVADDASTDSTPEIARAAGVEVVRAPRNVGKGGAATLAARHVVGEADVHRPPVFVLCDADLGETARHLPRLADEVRTGRAGLAVGAFQRRVGGGFGLALSFAGWAIRRRCGLVLEAPISGQRALSGAALRAALPFAPRFGMEIGMTVDVARAGLRVVEVDLPLAHRATGRNWRGFLHRGRQLADFLMVYLSRR
jgi:glycosyltransferase involved in cell wall biosynthesis